MKRVSWRISNIDDDMSSLCLSEVLNNELAIFGQGDNDSMWVEPLMMSITGANEKSNLIFKNGNNTEQQQCSSWVIYEKIPMGLGSTWG